MLDDDAAVRDALKKVLQRANYQVLTTGTYQKFTQNHTECDTILCDIILPDNDGLHALKWARQHYPHTPVIMMTGQPTFQTAAEAIRTGAYDYLVKPVNPQELLHTVERAIQHRRLTLEKRRLEVENEIYRLQLEQRVAEQTQALRESEEFLTTLTNTMADAVLSITLPDYTIAYVNQAVTDIFGYTPKELLGQSIEILYGNATNFNAFKYKQTAMLEAGQLKMRLEQPLRKKNGQNLWTEMVTTYLESEDETQLIAVIRDITERSLLLGMVAHELRNPLGLLNGFSTAMLDNLENINQENLQSYLGIINNSAKRMLNLVNEMLDLTKIELGEVSLQFELTDIGELLAAHAADYQVMARNKNSTLNYAPPSAPLICNCDPAKIGQVVANFIDNALKYSPSDSTIEVIGKKRNGTVWVGVKDAGPGIKPDEMQYLFTGFAQDKISSKPTAGEKSSGLGLVICKKIIEAHHGQIGVDSIPGQGATFWFSVPCQ